MRVRLRHDRLAEELAKRPVTLNRWAQILGLSSGHLSELTTGRRRYPTGATREKLLLGLGLEFEDLFEVEVAPQQQDAGLSAEPPQIADVSPAATPPGRAVPARWDGGAVVARRRSEVGRRPAPNQGADMELLSTLFSELRHALRQIARRPGFALAAVLTLAIGIGANFALFSLVNAALLRPYPYEEPDRVVDVRATRPSEGAEYFVSNWSWLNYLDLAERARGTIDLAAWDWEPFSLAGGDRPIRVGGGQVTANFFEVMGVRPLHGRTFTEAERAGDASLVVLGEAVWRNHFGADPGIVGRAVTLDGAPATVIGVMPGWADHPDLSAIWVPLRAGTDPQARGNNWARIYGRVSPGVEIDAAEERLRVVAGELAAEHPEFNEGLSAFVQSLREDEIGDVRPLFWVLLAVVLVVLLIVCANVASLLLSRSTERREEMALRSALGARRRQLLGQLLIETSVLAVLGVCAGVPLGYLALDGVRRLIPIELPAWFDVAPDGRVALYTAAVAVVALLLSGLAPALRTSKPLAARSRTGASGSVQAGRLRASLVVVQVALSVVLLVGAVLMVKSFATLGRVDPGFDPAGKLRLGIDLLALRSLPAEERAPRFERIHEALASVPGVAAVGAIDRIPLGNSSSMQGVMARGSKLGEEETTAVVSRVTPGYFDAIGLPVLQGGDFSWPIDAAAAAEVAISRQLAERAWPGESAVGREIGLGGGPSSEPTWRRVRAVVGDVRHYGLDDESLPGVYLVEGSNTMTRSTWVLRAESAAPGGGSASLDAVADAARAAVASVDPSQPLHDVMPLEEFVARSLWNERFFATVFSVFTGIAVLLAAVGLYGVLAYTVALRRREIGVRMALGAGRSAVAVWIAAQGLRLVVLGLLLGLPAAVFAGRALSGLLYGVDPVDLPALVLCPVLLLGVATFAILLPARRAARFDPATTLRLE